MQSNVCVGSEGLLLHGNLFQVVQCLPPINDSVDNDKTDYIWGKEGRFSFIPFMWCLRPVHTMPKWTQIGYTSIPEQTEFESMRIGRVH